MHKAAFPSIKEQSRNEIHGEDILGRRFNPPMFTNTSAVPPSSTASHQPYPFPWLTFAIKRGNLPTGGKRAPISKAKAPAMPKYPCRGRNDVPCPLSSSGGLGWLHPHPRRAQRTEQHQPTTPNSKHHFLLLSGLPYGNPFFGDTQQRSLISLLKYYLLNLKYYLPPHFTWTDTTILSTAGLGAHRGCSVCTVYLWLPLKARAASHPHPLRSNHPLENYNLKKAQKTNNQNLS